MTVNIILFFKNSLSTKSLWRDIRFLFLNYTNFIFYLLIFIFSQLAMSLNSQVNIYMWFRLILLTLFLIINIKQQYNREKILILLLVPIAIIDLIAVIQFFIKGNIGGIFYFLGERSFSINTPGIARQTLCLLNLNCINFLRPYSTFPHPNTLSAYNLVLFPFLIYILNNYKNIKYKIYFLITFFLLILTIFITFSFTVYLIFMLFCVIYFQRNIFVSQKKLILLITSFSLMLILSYGTIYAIKVDSITERINLYISGYEIWLKSPIVGVGWFNSLVYLPYTQIAKSLYFLQPIHNLYFLILVENGIIGFIFTIFILWKLLFKIFKILKKYLYSNKIFNIDFYISCSILMILGLSMFDHYFITQQQTRLIFVVTLLLLHTLNKTKSDNN